MTIPTSIDRYEIIEELGRGGMATVYKARDPLFEREVAVKVLPPALSRDQQFRARFIREARTIAALEHPAIVPVYDYGEDYSQPYLVMRYMTGGSLTDLLRQGPLSMAQTRQILQRIGSALDAAHQKGLIHRDLKPGNVLFDQYGEAYLADFGIVHVAASDEALTATGSLVGTPSYMSPEQVHGDKVLDGRSDIYALGVILFQMLTGDVPYAADTPVKTMMQHVMEPIPRILERRPDLAPQFDTIITKAMAKDRDARFATGGELSTALDDLINQTGAMAAAPPPAVPPVTPEPTPIPEPVRSEPVQVTPPPAVAEPVRSAPPSPQVLPKSEGSKRRGKGVLVAGVTVLVAICVAIVGAGIWVINSVSTQDEPITTIEEIPSEVTAVAEEIDAAATETAVSLIATRDQQAMDATAAAELPPPTDTAVPPDSREADLLATRQALEAAATGEAPPELPPLPTVPSEIARPTSGLQPIYGPSSGAIAHEDDSFLESTYADPSPADFIVSATFTNPFVGDWDIGFIFRQLDADDEMRLVVHSEGFWNLNDRDGDEDVFVAEGDVTGLLDLSANGQNEMLLAAIGEHGYFFLNGRYIATLDLSSRTAAGDLAIATGFYTDSEQPGASTIYSDFTVWPASPIYGPISGELEHIDDGFVKDHVADVNLYNFIAAAEFGSPYDTSIGSWDIGFTFRDEEVANQFWLIVDSDGDWAFIDRRDNEDVTLDDGQAASLNIDSKNNNQLLLIALNDRGYVLINDAFVTELNLSTRTQPGFVSIVTAFYEGDEIEGYATTFTDFTIWEMP